MVDHEERQILQQKEDDSLIEARRNAQKHAQKQADESEPVDIDDEPKVEAPDEVDGSPQGLTS